MNTLSFKTNYVTPEAADKKWVVVDAAGQTLGRLSSKVAKILRGKYKPCFTPNMDCGDNVIIINANQIVLSGDKLNSKLYITYSGYPGGQKILTPASILARPNGEEKLIKRVVKGMLPKNRLGAKQLGNLYVFAGEEHDKAAQQPKTIDINLYK